MDEKLIYSQVFDMTNYGLVILDKEYKVFKWNRWMEMHSEIPSKKIISKSLFEFFPKLNNPTFIRNFKSTLSFGNFCFFSQKLHQYLFPFKSVVSGDKSPNYMQQSCTIGPIRDEENKVKYVFISVQDVTDVVIYESKLLELSILDGLTGIYNRRYLQQRLSEEFDRHKRYSRSLSCIMLDIDHFKKVNDKYGHQAGDHVLIEVSKHLKKSLRSSDILARYGGEEFCILLSDTKLEDAYFVAERYRKDIEATEFNFKNQIIKVTISSGVIESKEGIDNTDEFIRSADNCLYEAKKSGRNKVVKDLNS